MLPELATLGRRIMILGPTNSGKSTLAVALGKKLGVPAVHIDLLRHFPDTGWVQRTDAEFHALHDAAILEPEWVMDGAYSVVMKQRIARATAIIVLDESLVTRYRRYFFRSLFQRRRAGAMADNRDPVSWTMISWLWKTRNKAPGTRQMAAATGLPTVFCHNERELNGLYQAWGLERG